jgi:hypothetical protein
VRLGEKRRPDESVDIFNRITRIVDDLHVIAEQAKSNTAANKASKANNPEQPQGPLVVSVDSAPNPHPEILEYYKSTNKDHRSTWTKLKPWIEGIGVFVGLLLLVANALTFWEIRKQTPKVAESATAATNAAATAAKQFEAADRPWVSVNPSIIAPITYNEKTGLHVDVEFALRNLGHAPAQKIWIDAHLVPGTMATDVSRIQKQACESSIRERPNFPGYILFPGDPYSQDFRLDLAVADINSMFSEFERSSGPINMAPTILVGCVGYAFESSKERHKTGFSFDILMSDRRVIVLSLCPLDPKSVILQRHFAGSEFAN